MSEFGFRPPCSSCRGHCSCRQPPYNLSYSPGETYYPPPPGPGGPPYQPPPGPGAPPYQPPPGPGGPPYQPPPYQPPSYPNYPGPGYQPGYTSYNWVDSYSRSGVPPNAVHGGTDIDGQPIYVGRAYHEGDWIPAKVIPGRNVTYVSYNMKEIPVDRFQVLCGQNAVHWIPDSSGRVPPNAIQAGKTKEGESLFIGRVNHAGALTVGKVHPSHRVCYIPFDGKELSFPSYEVLVSR